MNAGLFRLDVLEFLMKGFLLGKVGWLTEPFLYRKYFMTVGKLCRFKTYHLNCRVLFWTQQSWDCCIAKAQKYTLSLDASCLSYVVWHSKIQSENRSFWRVCFTRALQSGQKWPCTPQNLTRAIFPVALKSILTGAGVRSFGVVTYSILVTLVFNRAFVNVWRTNKSDISDSKFGSSIPARG